jgi:rod shape-determining protein MreC
VHEKTVRRRRAVLAVLVALSLILLTVYFGESPGGRLHSVQRDFLTVVSPIQDGANKALKPVRDFFNGIGDTLNAKSQRNALRKTVARLNRELASEQLAARRGTELAAQAGLDGQLGLGSYSPVNATVDGASPTPWYSTVLISKGSNAGIQFNDPVMDWQGLVGRVSALVGDGAQVTLITDQSSGVAAELSSTGQRGIIEAQGVGHPGVLELQFLQPSGPVQPGQEVVTAGTVSSADPDLFPPGIPIGSVSSVDESTSPPTVYVKPYADLGQLDVVQVLTQGGAGSRASRAIAALRQLPPAGSEPTSSLGAAGAQRASTGAAAGG